MVKEAERFSDEDRRKREDAETRNRGDSLVYQIERMLRDAGDKVTADERKGVEEKLQALKDALGRDDAAATSRATDELQQASGKLAEAMYARTGAAAGAPTGAPGGGQGGEGKAGDEVIDAEFKRQDEKPS
jgi:molecular chaperone DnaK